MTARIRLVAWNSKAKGSDNVPAIRDRFRPDIVVVPEYAARRCEAPEGFSLVDIHWRSYRPLTVLAAKGWELDVPDAVPPIGGGIILPVEISGPVDFRLVAVAAALSKPTPEVNPVVEAAEAWADWLRGPVVVAGDFGSGWPMSRQPAVLARSRAKPESQQHGPVVEALGSLGLCSAYHARFGVAQGDERDATYWHKYRGKINPFHIDHVFASADLKVTALEVGTWDEFHQRSDHAPMFVELMCASALRF